MIRTNSLSVIHPKQKEQKKQIGLCFAAIALVASLAAIPSLTLAAEDDLSTTTPDAMTAGQITLSQPQITSPKNEQNFGKPKPIVSGKVEFGDEALVFIDGVFNGIAPIISKKFAYRPFLPLPSGRHTVIVVARDKKSGEKSVATVVTFVIGANPAPTLLAPKAGTRLGQDRVWVGGVVKNDSRVKVLVDQKEYGWAKAVNHKSGTASFGLELKGLSLGEHTVLAMARDKRGKDSFLSQPLPIKIFSKTSAPVLRRPVVNADAGIERPFIIGLVKKGLIVGLVVDGRKVATLSTHPGKNDVASFSWQPTTALALGRHKIEAFASDNGKLSNNSKPVFWQVGEVAAGAIGAPEDKKDKVTVRPGAATGRVTVKDDKETGRIKTDEEMGGTAAPSGPPTGGAADEVREVGPGAVVRNLEGEAGPRRFNTSLIIGIVILAFLVISIVIWYIQERRGRVSDKVMDMFRESEEGEGKTDDKPMDDFSVDSWRQEDRKDDNLPPPPPPMF